MKIFRHFSLAIVLTLLLLTSAVTAFADSDPPSRAVDIHYISGEVSIQPGGVDDWVAAVVNRPLTTADRVWTDKDARAELHLGTSALRMNAETSLTLTNVDDQTVQVELDQGTLNLWVRHLYDGEVYEVDTPNLAFTISQSGNYRFDVDPNGDTTQITVWNGDGTATGQGNGVEVRSGEHASFTNGTSLEHQVSSVPGFDGFDDWCRVRDERAAHLESTRYVSPDMVGVDDLDEYGHWRAVPEYGSIWVPSHVDEGWAPYHDGHWVWVEPWGWTWVDDAPWGFAPCHYGRWVYTGGYWGWAPGPLVVSARPVYAPALVAWVGGAHWGVGVSFGAGFGAGGGVGWFPLGWNEPFVPTYGVSREYFTRVNVTNIHVTNVTVINNYYNNSTVVNNIRYTNRTVPGGFTAVPVSAMGNGQAVARVAVRVPPAEIERAPMAAAAPVAPSRNAVLGVNAGQHAAIPPARAVSRTVVTKAAPPPRPIPFAAKQEALARNPGRPLDAQTQQQIRATMPAQATRNPGNAGNPGAPRNQASPANLGAARPNPATPQGRVVPRPPQPGQNPNAPGNANATRNPNPTAPQERPVSPQNTGRMNTPQQPATNIPNRVVPRPPSSGQGTNPAMTRPSAPTPEVQRGGANETRPPSQPSENHGRQPAPSVNRSAPRPPENAAPTHAAPNVQQPRPQPQTERLVPRPPSAQPQAKPAPGKKPAPKSENKEDKDHH